MSKKLLVELQLELDRRKVFRLDRYPAPTPLDRAAALATTTLKTKMGQPKVEGWTLSAEGPTQGFFTAHRETTSRPQIEPGVWYASSLDALIAHRNRVAQRYADKLIVLDASIKNLPEMSCDAGNNPDQDTTLTLDVPAFLGTARKADTQATESPAATTDVAPEPERTFCPKCQQETGDSWGQCGGECPMPMSPHYKPPVPSAMPPKIYTAGKGPGRRSRRKAD